MIVFVNDTPVKTYYGAKVKSAVWAYFRDHDIPVKTFVKEVRDAYGNLIDMVHHQGSLPQILTYLFPQWLQGR